MKNLFKISITGLFLLLLSFTIQSCNSSKNIAEKLDDKELPVKLTGTWILSSIDGIIATDAFKGAAPTLNFDFEKGRVYGNGGCNQYNGSFALIGNIYNPSPMISTLMACAEYNQEYRLLELLGEKSTLILKSYTLQFVQDGNVVLEFTPKAR